jgi:hypothetical protein
MGILTSIMSELGLTVRYPFDHLVDAIPRPDEKPQRSVNVGDLASRLLTSEVVVTTLLGLETVDSDRGEHGEFSSIALDELARGVAVSARSLGHSEVTSVHFLWFLMQKFSEQMTQVISRVCCRPVEEVEKLLKDYLNSPYYPFGSEEYSRYKKDHPSPDDSCSGPLQGFLSHAAMDVRYEE